MRIIFWLNCLSPHQLPYISKLTKDKRIKSVIIVSNEAINAKREKMGWSISNISEIKKCDIYIKPSTETIEFLLSDEINSSFHFFSGIRGFKFVRSVLIKSLNFNIKRGIIAEKPFTYYRGVSNAKPEWLHKIRYRFFDRNIINKIDYVFAIGQESYRFYSELSCKWKVYPFIYCTEITNKSENHLFNDNVTKYIFVGSLDKRKNLICVLKAINDLKKYNITNFQLTIIGGGSELTRVKSYINKNNIQNIIFKGVLDNSKIANELSNNDILILPSLYDGWGAVINEALNEGLYIICSNMCGAKDLISNDSIGMIYDNNQNMHLSEKIIYACNNLDLIRENKKNRALWAKNKINGETLANYFTDCISGIEANAPWKSNV